MLCTLNLISTFLLSKMTWIVCYFIVRSKVPCTFYKAGFNCTGQGPIIVKLCITEKSLGYGKIFILWVYKLHMLYTSKEFALLILFWIMKMICLCTSSKFIVYLHMYKWCIFSVILLKSSVIYTCINGLYFQWSYIQFYLVLICHHHQKMPKLNKNHFRQ